MDDPPQSQSQLPPPRPPPQPQSQLPPPRPPPQPQSQLPPPPPPPPTPPQTPPPLPPQSSVDDWWEQVTKLRKYLLLLASLAATVTYAAGFHPPGGSWGQSDYEKMAVAGDPILRATNHRLYLAFYYSNATAFAASLVVILLLLVLADKKGDRPQGTGRFGFLWQQTTHILVLRLVMVLDLLALMVAYTAGSCRDKVATIYTVALVAALSAYVGYHILEALHDYSKREWLRPPPRGVESTPLPAAPLSASSPDQAQALRPPNVVPPPTSTNNDLEQLRKVVMLLAIFAATITYNAGLNPPGGFWEHANGLHRPGEVILKHKHGGRFAVFFLSNTAAFIASLFTVVLLLDRKLTTNAKPRLRALSAFVLVTLVTLVAAYAAGSCRNTATTTYTVALVAAVLVSIFLAAVAGETGKKLTKYLRRGFDRLSTNGNWGEIDEKLKEKRSLVLLLGTLAASITYQAGLSPPGGVWFENQSGSHGHIAGDPILLNTDNMRYTIFFYCNSVAFVASLVVILMVQIKALLEKTALKAAIMFDLVGLMGAYIAGSSRTLRASVHVIVMAAAFLVYVTGTYLLVRINPPTTAATSTTNNTNSEDPQPQNNDAGRTKSIRRRRKRLLLFAILMATITYQAGLSPPGGFWRVEQGHSSVGSPILEDMYPRRYKAFFYCNAMSFMASIALIILLQGDKTYQPAAGLPFYGLYACMLVGMLVLMGAYAAGTARRVRTSIYVFVLVGGVSVFIAVLLALFVLIQRRRRRESSVNRQSSNVNGENTAGNNDNDNVNSGGDDNHRHRGGHHTTRKYVMLLAMLAASVTYQAALDPPGGVWPDGYDAGSPVLHDSNLRRYHIFFYSNSSSFMASIVVIILLLQSERRNINKCQRQQQLQVLLQRQLQGLQQKQQLQVEQLQLQVQQLQEEQRQEEQRQQQQVPQEQQQLVHQEHQQQVQGEQEQQQLLQQQVLQVLLDQKVLQVQHLQQLVQQLQQLQQEHHQQVQQVEQEDMPLLLTATNTVVALDLVGLLVAYAAGSSRTMDTSLYVAIVLVIAVVIFIVVYIRLDCLSSTTLEGREATRVEASVGNISMEQMGGMHKQMHHRLRSDR